MKRWLSNWWTLSILTALIVAVLLVVVLPLIVLALKPWWVRLLLFLLVLAVWGLAAFLHVRKSRRASDAIARELATPSPEDTEAQALSQRMVEALATLKKGSGQRDYLYRRPWYIIIGPPGAGKTTALLKSGLRFPLSEVALAGVGGTRNMDFWFAEEATLVDTAGRYTLQDSDAQADARGWEKVLRLLRKHRPLQPINGVLVAIGIDELLRADRARIDAHASAMRRRLNELSHTLQIEVPVYVLFTKADLIAGFTEFWDDLDVQGRRAVLGATLPLDAAPTPERLAGEFDALAQAIDARSAKRLQEELDARRRGLILGFPGQLQSLRARALRLLDGIFAPDQPAVGRLRGFYLTSGVQSGAPLDRLLSSVAQVYDQPQREAAGAEGGRAFFLNRLLQEVIFGEAGLVSSTPRAAKRRRTILLGGYAAIGAVAALLLIAWTVSYFANRDLQERLLTSARNVQEEMRVSGIDLAEVRSSDPGLEQSLSVLRALRELPRGYAESGEGSPPLTMRFGLFQSGHAQAAREAYLESLRRIMLPRLLLRQETVMQQGRDQPLTLYEPLKVYLMLGGQGRLDREAVAGWVRTDWERDALPGADRSAVREELGEHLTALLQDQDLNRVWPGRQAPIDGALVASARRSVQTLSLADRAFAILRQKAMSAGPAWRAGDVLTSGDAQAFASPEAVNALSVPYFFTRAGYEGAYLPGLQSVQADLRRDLWVLGEDAEKAGVQQQIGAIAPGVARLYAQEYSAAWDGVLGALQPGAYFSDPTAYGAFTRQPSPFKQLLLEVRKNTVFTGGGSADGGAAAAARGAAEKRGASSRIGAAAAGLARGSGSGPSNGSSGGDAAAQITAHFQPLHDYVGDGEGPAPVDEFIAAIKNAGIARSSASATVGGIGVEQAQSEVARAMGGVAAAAAAAPPSLQGFAAQAAQGGRQVAIGQAQGAVADAYLRNILPSCRSITQDRYPFYGAALSEATVSDMLRFFGTRGQMDEFQSARLAPLLETDGPVWRWRTDDPVAAAFDPASAEQFQKAAQLRELLSAGQQMRVSAAGFGGAVGAFELMAGGQTFRFEAGATTARPLLWTLNSAPEARLTLFSDGQPVRTFEEEGVWALFRLIDQARRENSGPTSFKATFGEGATSATLRIALPSEVNPFSRGGLWSFRCPAAL